MKKLITYTILVMSSLTVQAASQAESLFNTINERLSYMEDVALFKANNHLPIEDVEREKVVVKKAIDSAANHGLSPQQTKAFFQAQIAVAKAIQYRHRADWLSQPASNQPRDLHQVIRPELLTLGNQINVELAAYIEQNGKISAKQEDMFKQSITVKYVSESDKELLFNALKKIELK
ncbi:chorismate mutase [Photobacterium sanctipauli]|uniref:chorismate mutase n=2 Tax=Photobacterium sanctipauli TaxID=1342794 RepID=A0A2T3NVA7_9GAMM|nr:chorismate mutase [Photobacterium sanctipauli]PSW20171.1 chorismate mutase [Photobacterium sanctipauli]